MIKKLAIFVLMCLLAVTFGGAFAEGETTATTTGSVNVRKAPDIDSEVIGYLAEGVEIAVKDFIYTYDGRTWCQVGWQGKDGYISDRYLAFDEEVLADDVYNISRAMVTTGMVNVREAASIDATSIDTLAEGTTVDVLVLIPTEDGRVWAEIYYDNGDEYVYAYISMKYLEPYDELPELAKHMMVNGGSVNIREEPNINSRGIGILKCGDVIDVQCYVFSSDGRIWASRINDGESDGWISCRYLEAN